MSVWWHVHRNDWHPKKDTVRGMIEGTGTQGSPKTFQTVERISTLIPAGEYLCKYDYWHGGKMPAYEIIWPHDEDGDGHPDRDRLLIHPANAIRNKGGEFILLGCIALGMGRAEFWGPDAPPLARDLPGVTSSRIAVASFMKANDGLKEFMLKITEEGHG